MNTNQKYVLALATIIMVLMLLYPPFQNVTGQYGTINNGYHFITYLPTGKGVMPATVNIGLLIMQWIVLGAVAFVAYLLLKDKS